MSNLGMPWSGPGISLRGGRSEPACATTVTGDGTPLLPATGADPSAWMPILLIGAVLVLVGGAMLLARRRRAGSATTLAALAACAVVLSAASPSGAQAADRPAGCALIGIDRVEGQRPSPLLPGDSAPGLSYRVRNVTAFPIAVSVSTTVRSDPGVIAAALTVTLTTTGGPDIVSSLAEMPPSQPLHLQPGATLTAAYSLALPGSVDDSIQGRSVLYDSTVTATER